MASKSQILATLADTLQLLKEAGAEYADVTYKESSSLSVGMRNGLVESFERIPQSSGIGMTVRVGHKSASVSPDTKRAGLLKESARAAVAAARLKTDNPDQALPDRALLSKIRNNKKLDLLDRTKPGADEMIRQLRDTESAARAVRHIKDVSGASASWSRSRTVSLDSNGDLFESERSGSYFGASVIAENGGPLATGHEYTQTIHRADLRDAESVGRKAAEDAVKQLNPRRAPATGKLPVIFDPDVAAGLLGHFAQAASGGSIFMNQSFLTKDSLEQKVLATGITITNDPHRLRSRASGMFTNSGLPTKAVTVADKGVLKSLFLGLESARRLGFPLTAIKGDPGNLTIEAGAVSRAALLAGVKEGFYVTGVMGQGVNVANGDYSRGASGFWIENGVLTHAVNEATIAGNLRDMFMNMVAADDLDVREKTSAAPTLRVDGMTIA
ncbi:MAG: modulator of gyrase family protein [Micavibrio sp.]|nr:modulator of gyrase family protein [Micavibrio sp.]